MDAALKMTRQYFVEMAPSQQRRVSFIARRQSYHGMMAGSLSMCGHRGRRAVFDPMFLSNMSHVSSCKAYRGDGGERG